MDMDGMMKAGTALKEAMKDDKAMMAMSDEEVMKAAEEACKMHADATVMDAVHM
jgi:succinyl-CoA synthetase alpha subunit